MENSFILAGKVRDSKPYLSLNLHNTKTKSTIKKIITYNKNKTLCEQ